MFDKDIPLDIEAGIDACRQKPEAMPIATRNDAERDRQMQQIRQKRVIQQAVRIFRIFCHLLISLCNIISGVKM